MLRVGSLLLVVLVGMTLVGMPMNGFGGPPSTAPDAGAASVITHGQMVVAQAAPLVPPGPGMPSAQPQGYRVLRLPPRQFVPFDYRDPRTGRPLVNPQTRQALTPATPITLPNGKTMTVGHYLDQINAIEQRLTSMGYSLRDKRGVTKIGEPAITPAALQSQAAALRAMHPQAPKPDVMREIGQLRASGLTNLGLGRAGGTPAASPCGMFDKPWSWSYGDPNSFWASANGDLRLTACTKTVWVTEGGTFQGQGITLRNPVGFAGTFVVGNAQADVAVIGNRRGVASANASLSSPKSGPLTASLQLVVLGQTRFNLNEQAQASKTWGCQPSCPSYPFDFSYTTTVTLMGVPLTVQVGAGGAAGVSYSITLQPDQVLGGLEPVVTSQAYGRITAGLQDVAEAGVVGEINPLLNDDVQIKAVAQLQVDPQRGPYLAANYYAYDTVDALGGDLKVFGCVWVPNWPDVWDFHKECQEQDLWHGGAAYHAGHYIFNEAQTVYLTP